MPILNLIVGPRRVSVAVNCPSGDMMGFAAEQHVIDRLTHLIAFFGPAGIPYERFKADFLSAHPEWGRVFELHEDGISVPGRDPLAVSPLAPVAEAPIVLQTMMERAKNDAKRR